MSELFGVIDANGVFKYASPSHKLLLGLEPETYIRNSAYDFVHPDDVHRVKEQVAHLITTKQPLQIVFRYKHLTRGWHQIEASGIPIADNAGNLESIVVVARLILPESGTEQDEPVLQSMKLPTLFHFANDLIFVAEIPKNGDPFFVEVNDIVCRKLQYSKEQIYKLSYTLISDPFYLQKLPEIVDKVRSQLHYRYEWGFLDKNGITLMFDMNSTIYEMNGRLFLLTIARELTDRKQVETPYECLFENYPDAIISIDLNRNILSINTAATGIIGYEKEEIYKSRIEDVIAPKDQAKIRQFFENVLNGESLTEQFTIISKTGRLIDITISAIPVIIDNRITGIYGVAKDISEWKRVETTLIENRDKFQIVFNSLASIIFLAKEDPHGRIRLLEMNETAKRLLGYEENEWRSMTFLNMFSEKDHIKIVKLFKKLPISQKITFKADYLAKDLSSLPVEVTVQMYEMNKENILLILARDLRQVKRGYDSENFIEDRGKHLRVIMAEMDINASELAAMTGLSIVTISNLRTGKIGKPHQGTAKLIADALGVDVSDIWPNIHS